MANCLQRRLQRELAALAGMQLARQLPAVRRTGPVTYDLAGRNVVGLCSNDYLGLAADPRLHNPTSTAIPTGAGASRLINGDWPELRATEERLADLAATEDAVLFPSGFQANVGVLPALLRQNDTVFSDRLAHASLIDGLRLAPARTCILPHGSSPPRLTPGPAGLHMWVTESIFSMDGDQAPLAALRSFVDDGHALYLDEAHAVGLFPAARPWSVHHGLTPTVLLGTLGKALGCAGAFAAASRTICTWIRTRCRSFVFSTGVSPLLARSVSRAVDLVRGPPGDELRARLWTNAARLSVALGSSSDPPSPIFPLVVGTNALALSVATDLLDRGFHVQPIRPPTVPAGTARLRITVSAAHTPEQLDRFVDALTTALRPHGLEPSVLRGQTEPLTFFAEPAPTGTHPTGTDPAR